VVEKTPSAIAGLQIGDKVLAVDDQTVSNLNDLRGIINLGNGAPLLFKIEREGAEFETEMTPEIREIEDPTYGKIKIPTVGLVFGKYQHYNLGILGSAKIATEYCYEMSILILKALKQMIFGQRGFGELSGPIKIAQFSGKSMELGFESAMRFIAMISLNLGLINLLPIPLLDGGHLLLYGLQGIYGKPIPDSVQKIGFKIGLVLIVLLMIISTWNDIAAFFVK
jgi:regulator of sigma E protease